MVLFYKSLCMFVKGLVVYMYTVNPLLSGPSSLISPPPLCFKTSPLLLISLH